MFVSSYSSFALFRVLIIRQFRQQDAHEFLVHLFDTMRMEERSVSLATCVSDCELIVSTGY